MACVCRCVCVPEGWDDVISGLGSSVCVCGGGCL